MVLILSHTSYSKMLDSQIFPGIQGGPLMHVIAAKAVAFQEALQPEFRQYQERVVANSRRLSEVLSDHGYRLVSGGTDNHLMLVDLTAKGLTGKVAEETLDKAGITVNKNAIPFDTLETERDERNQGGDSCGDHPRNGPRAHGDNREFHAPRPGIGGQRSKTEIAGLRGR